MKVSVFWSSYDSASSRAHAPHAWAALKSNKMGRDCSLDAAKVWSISLLQFTPIIRLLEEVRKFSLDRLAAGLGIGTATYAVALPEPEPRAVG